MGKINERTLRMKQEFMELHRQGMEIKEIAKKFHLSLGTVYDSLQEIADVAGVSRKSLLERPHEKHTPFIRETGKPLIPVNREKFNSHYDAVLGELNSLREVIKTSVAEQEEFLEGKEEL